MSKQFQELSDDDIDELSREELTLKFKEMQKEIIPLQKAYYIRPNNEYKVERTETQQGYVFYYILIDNVTDKFKTRYGTPKVLINMGKENNDIPDGSTIKIIDMHEGYYKKGFNWVFSIFVNEFDVISKEETTRDKIDDFKQAILNRQDNADDDLFF